MKEVKNAQDAGFPVLNRQLIIPEKRKAKYSLSEMAAKKTRPDAPLTDINGKWASTKVSAEMAAKHSYLPPLNTPTQPSHGKAPKEPKNGRNKENKVIHVPPVPNHQSTITAHTVHQFKPADNGSLKFKVPELMKNPQKNHPQKNVGKYTNKLPTKMRHRACTFCLRLYPSKTSRIPNGLTPYLHVITSECPFVRQNCMNTVEKLVCYGCFESFDMNKCINEDILSHIEMNDHDVICHICRQVMPYSEMYGHLVLKYYSYFEAGVTCTRCDRSFQSCKSWVQHIKTVHSISSPNMAHFNRFLPIVQKDMQIREAMLFACLHCNSTIS